MGRARPCCVYMRPAYGECIAGLIGAPVPASTIVCVKDRMPCVAGDSLVPTFVGLPRLVAAAAAAAADGACEDQQRDNAEDDVQWYQIF